MDQENELLELSGTVESIIYKNEENGYTVLRLKDGNGEVNTVVGCFPCAEAGESMIISGEWTVHGVHGRQFKAEFAQRMMPASASAIYSYLAGGSVRGIGPATASLIVNEFGEKTLDVLENHPELLGKIKGISQTKAEGMSKSFRRQAGIRRLVEFVCSFNVRPVLAMRLYKFYGDNALEIVRDNPYIIASSHIGGTFAEADSMALEMGLGENSTNRICAAVIFELVHNAGNGHCFIPREKLSAATAELIGVDTDSVDGCIENLIENGQLFFERIANQNACYLPALYEAETETAERIGAMSRSKMKDRADTDKLVHELEKRFNIKYAPLQRQTLELALKNQVILITGGPGTGKTTSIRAILALFEQLELETMLAAPTGRAAKRMTELTGQEAFTVHRLLEAKFADDDETVIFGKNSNDPLKCDAVILDECSMVDITLIAALLDAMPNDARLVLVGDADQLPSVGPGNVFSSIIRSGVVPTVRLTEIFRQTGESRIIRNAHMINRGEHPDLGENAGDFFRLKRLQAGSSVDTIIELCANRLPAKMGIPSDQIQVLSPTRKGELGTFNLNKRLQEALNPADRSKKEKLFGDYVFREGDKVMQIKNNYDIVWHNETNTVAGSGIYNGDIGYIREISAENQALVINFEGRIASYAFDSLNELEHAWAMTVHKSQGSEYRAVVLALGGTSQMLLSRGVLYTAVTRAKKLLVMVGDDQVAYQMIDNYRQTRRYTALAVRLKALAGVL